MAVLGHFLSWVTFSFFATQGLGAQPPEKVPPRFLRVMTLGEHPPFRQEIREGARYEIDPEPGTVPPPFVLVERAEGEVAERVALRLGSPTRALALPLGREPGFLTLLNPDGKRWTRIPFAGEGSTLTLLWRGGKLWDETRALPLPDGPQAFPAESCRFVNVAALKVGIAWGDDARTLAPGEILLLNFPSEEVLLQVLLPTEEGPPRICFETTVERLPSLSQQFFFYRADGENSRLPIRVLPWREPR